MVGGAPGSGKTTLALRLAQELQVPHVNRDSISRGIRFTEGAMPEPTRSWEIFYSTLADLLGHGLSLVMDMTMYRGISEQDIGRRLLPLSHGRHVHCESDRAFERFKARELARGDPDEYRRVMSVYHDAQPLVGEPLDLGVARLCVDTTEGYRPSIDVIVSFIRQPGHHATDATP
jgi:DNA polymerase III delta prime subunit